MKTNPVQRWEKTVVAEAAVSLGYINLVHTNISNIDSYFYDRACDKLTSELNKQGLVNIDNTIGENIQFVGSLAKCRDGGVYLVVKAECQSPSNFYN